MNPNLNQLLLRAWSDPAFRISGSQLKTDFPDLKDLLLKQGLLIPAQAENWITCALCGQTHPVFRVNGVAYFNCDQDESCGLERVEEAKLKRYRFSQKQFLEVLCRLVGIKASISSLLGGFYLGEFQKAGKKHPCYIASSQEREAVYQLLDHLASSDAILFWLHEDVHFKSARPNLINILEYLDLSVSGLTFDTQRLKRQLGGKIPSQMGDILLDKHIVLRQQRKKHKLLFHQNSDYTYLLEEPIRPQTYRVLALLYQIRKYHENAQSAQELASRGLAKRARTITRCLKEANDLAQKHGTKAITARLAQYRYTLNPDLDCMS